MRTGYERVGHHAVDDVVVGGDGVLELLYGGRGGLGELGPEEAVESQRQGVGVLVFTSGKYLIF